MLQWLLNLLPDWGWRTGFEILRDLLSLGMAGLGAYLAYLAIKMGRRQTAIGEEQTRIGTEQMAIALRQEALDIEQGNIAKRQAEIAEVQHGLLEKQLATQPLVEVMVVGMLQRAHLDGSGRQVLLTLAARNNGSRVAEGFFWEIRFPARDERVLKFATSLWGVDEYGAEVKDGVMFWLKKDFYDKKLFAGTHVDVARILVEAEGLTERVVLWKVQGENGEHPKDEYGEISIGPRETLLDVRPVYQS